MIWFICVLLHSHKFMVNFKLYTHNYKFCNGNWLQCYLAIHKLISWDLDHINTGACSCCYLNFINCNYYRIYLYLQVEYIKSYLCLCSYCVLHIWCIAHFHVSELLISQIPPWLQSDHKPIIIPQHKTKMGEVPSCSQFCMVTLSCKIPGI